MHIKEDFLSEGSDEISEEEQTITGNTHFGRFLNEDRINEFCDRCIKYLENKLDIIVTIGTDTKYTDKYLEENNYTNYYHFNNESESHEKIKELLHEGDAVLFKGSHAIKLGNIVKYLMEE